MYMPDTKILSSKTVFTSKFFKVINKNIERNGKRFSKDLIEKNPIVLIIPYTADNEIYIESQYRDAFGGLSLEVVAGTIENNDDPLDTAKRELEEEAGLSAKSWKKIAQWQISSNMNAVAHFFIATDLKEGKQHLDEDEEITILKLPFEEVLKKVENGEMKVAYHIAALLLFDRLRKEGKI
jgi:ADP-ribose diphosphatase